MIPPHLKYKFIQTIGKDNYYKLGKGARYIFICVEMEKFKQRLINEFGIKTKACCCGHGKYPMTLIVEYKFDDIAIFSGIKIPREKRFYKKDKEGYYYIPEVINTNLEVTK